MGTSKSLATPKGGAFTAPKKLLTDLVNGQTDNPQVDTREFVRGALGAIAGIAFAPRATTNGGEGTGFSGTSGKGRTGRSSATRNGGGVSSGSALGGALQGLGGFGTQISSAGLDSALQSLGLQDLRGRPAAEVIARVAERLSSSATGRQAEIMETALRDTIFDIAAAEGTGSYEDLEGTLQTFVDREGVDGFVESFLSQYVFTAVWSYFENHAANKAEGASDPALASAVENACRSLVSEELQTIRETQNFDRIDWFGAEGQRFAERMVSRLQSQIGSGE